MTIIDWVLIAILGFFFIRGLFRGFLLELFDVVALVAGYFAARIFGALVAQPLAEYTPLERGAAGVVAAIVLFIAAAILTGMLARLLRKVVRAAALGWLDRSLGAVLGLLKAALIIFFLMLVMRLFPLSKPIIRTISQGPISGTAWIISGALVEQLHTIPIEPTRVFASYLKGLGLNDEVIHIITDQTDLTKSLLKHAPVGAGVPVSEILKGEPSIPKPQRLAMPDDVSRGIAEALQSDKLNTDQKAEIFWNLVAKAEISEK